MTSSRIAVVPVRDGRLPVGGDEVVAEAGGRALLIGSDTASAAGDLRGVATEADLVEVGDVRPARWSALLVDRLRCEDLVILPASPDGRDLAPRIAHGLDRPIIGGAVRLDPRLVVAARGGSMVEYPMPTQLVATLQPGVRSVIVDPDADEVIVRSLALEPDGAPTRDAELVALVAPDPATMDLGDATRLLGGGVGLGDAETFELLHELAKALGASVGATRVVTDLGWTGFDRQIGTTGVLVDPELYLAFGISGAVQHVSGLGQPEHIVSVNLDGSCPMMAMADLAVVCDAPAVLAHLIDLLATEAEVS